MGNFNHSWIQTPPHGLAWVWSNLSCALLLLLLLLPLTKLAKNISHASQLQNPNKIRKPVQWLMPSWNVLSYQLENYKFIYKLNLPSFLPFRFLLLRHSMKNMTSQTLKFMRENAQTDFWKLLYLVKKVNLKSFEAFTLFPTLHPDADCQYMFKPVAWGEGGCLTKTFRQP